MLDQLPVEVAWDTDWLYERLAGSSVAVNPKETVPLESSAGSESIGFFTILRKPYCSSCPKTSDWKATDWKFLPKPFMLILTPSD